MEGSLKARQWATAEVECIEMVCLCPSAHLNNCSDQVIGMAQVQQIYARLFTHIDVATSLLLKQDLIDAEFCCTPAGRRLPASARRLRRCASRLCLVLSLLRWARSYMPALLQSSNRLPIL
jgi:hypothetical protein